MPVSTAFPERLRMYRKRKRLTQLQLAQFLGVSQAAVAKWESGQAEPDMARLNRLSVLFGVPLDVLCGDGSPESLSLENMAVMARAFRALTPEEQEKLIAVGRTLFADAFSGEEKTW